MAHIVRNSFKRRLFSQQQGFRQIASDYPLRTRGRYDGHLRFMTTQKEFLQETEEGAENNDDDEDEEDSQQLPLPWKSLLEIPARAGWRVSDPHPPVKLHRAVKTLLKDGNRTPKQLKRAHMKVLEMHSIMAEFRERERRRMVNGKYYRGKDAAEEADINPVFYGYDETLATLKHRLYPNFSVTKRVLEECRSLLGPDVVNPERIIDFGIGCGSASAAALEVFPDSVRWIHGIDPSQPMRDCSQRLIEDMSSENSSPPRVTFSTALSVDENTAGGSFELALFAYSATDLPDVTSTLAAAAMLFEKLKPNGIFVMIEPGTPDGFNSVRSVRNMLLDCCPPEDPEFEWDERCHIIAPCTHNGECPMVRHKKDFIKKGKLPYDILHEDFQEAQEKIEVDEANEEDFIDLTSDEANLSETEAFNSSFCSFVQTVPGSDSRKGEKFSYLVAQKRIHGEDENVTDAFPEDNVATLLAAAQDSVSRRDENGVQRIFAKAKDLQSRYIEADDDDLGLELLRGDVKRGAMGRIVRAPIKRKGHVYIDYCSAPGRIIRGRVAKSSGNVAPGMWTAARKSRWGGFWPDTMDKIEPPPK